MKLYLDPGHGGTDPGAIGNGLQEKNITLEISLRIRDLLISRYNNVQVQLSRTGDTTKSLAQRTSEANTWGADYFLSIHCNAFDGSANGYEDFIHSSLSDTSQTARYRDLIHPEVTRRNNLRNRGKKKADFHVLRESSMPAMLSENGFIDNSGDASLMKQPSWLQSVAQGHVEGLARAFNLEVKAAGGQLYKVIAGAFTSRSNAEERLKFLSEKQIDAFIDTTNLSGDIWYRVQAGAFSERTGAEAHLQTVLDTGIDAFIFTQ